MILVTGGAGFIGSNFIVDWLANSQAVAVINYDKLTYAGNLANLQEIERDPRHQFVQGDIADQAKVLDLLRAHQVQAIVNFAAESHVDRSIHGPADFIQTNVLVLSSCSRRSGSIGVSWMLPQKINSVFYMFQQMKSMAH